MSRSYRVLVQVKNITEEEIEETMNSELGWEQDGLCWEGSGVIYYEGTGVLCGGLSELEAHEQIKELLKKINSKFKILTQWTNLDEIPFEEYGSLE